MTHNTYFAGLFLIGLAAVAYYHYWWPGIMFALGGAMLLGELLETKQFNIGNSNIMSGLILIGIGLLSMHTTLLSKDSFLPVLFAGLGIFILFNALKRR